MKYGKSKLQNIFWLPNKLECLSQTIQVLKFTGEVKSFRVELCHTHKQ